MLRGTWKARSPDEVDEEDGDEGVDDGDDDDGNGAEMEVQTEPTRAGETEVHGELDGSSQSTIAPQHDRRHTPRGSSRDANTDANTNGQGAAYDRPLHLKSRRHPRSKGNAVSVSDSVDALTTSLSSLSLLPPSVRFGRGAAHGGFMAAQRGRGYGRGGPRGGRRGMYNGGIGGTHIAQDAGGERGAEVTANGVSARVGDGGDDSRAMIPRVLTGKKERGRSGNAAGASRERGRGGRRT